MTAADRKRFIVILSLTLVGLFGAGVAYWIFAGQHHHICPDGLPPLAQQDEGLGQLVYKCRGGVIVTGAFLP